MKARVLLLALGLVLAASALYFALGHERRIEAIAPAAPVVATEHETRRLELAPLAAEPSAGAARDLVADAAESATPAAATPASDATPLADGEAQLLLHIVSKEAHAPLEGIVVYAHDAATNDWDSDMVESAHARAGETPRTGADGKVDFVLPGGHDWEVYATGSENAGSRNERVEDLAAGERRTLEIALPTTDDVHFCGQVREKDGGRPIANATVALCAQQMVWSEGRGVDRGHVVRELRTDDEGRFELQGSSWRQQYARASAPGFSTVRFETRTGHETRENELAVLLPRGASVRAHLSDASGAAIEGAELVLRAPGYRIAQQESTVLRSVGGDAEWRATSARDGTCVLEDLPPEIGIDGHVERDRQIARRLREPLQLQPGEFRELELKLGAGVALHGQVLDQSDAPVAATELWLVGQGRGGGAFFTSWQRDGIVARTSSDAGGAFRFDDVAPGSYLLGPAPLEWGEKPEPDAVAAVGVEVRIADEPREQEFTLRVHRGLFVRGRVVDPEGAGVKSAWIQVQGLDTPGWTGLQADDDGSFVAGPLAPGRYRIDSGGFGDCTSFASSESLDVQAGDAGLVLHVRPGSCVSGTIVDAASGEPIDAEVTVSTTKEGGEPNRVFTATNGGRFELGGLEAGSFTVCASDAGRVGWASGKLATGEKREGLKVELAPGAKIVLSYEGTREWCHVSVTSEAGFESSTGLERGKPQTFVVPPGDFTLAISSGESGATPERQSVHAELGKPVQLTVRRP